MTFFFLVEGSSDDLDVPIKKVLSDAAYSAKRRLLSLNSINWGRIMMQVVSVTRLGESKPFELLLQIAIVLLSTN